MVALAALELVVVVLPEGPLLLIDSIVNYFGAFQDEVRIYMMMEYVIGGELFSQLRKAGRFPNEASKFYAAEIILALQFLHDRVGSQLL